MPAFLRTRAIAPVVLAVFGGASLGCATAPLASVSLPPSFEQKLANIVRLEDQRVLADPVVPPSMPAPSRRDRRAAVVPPPPRIDDLTALLADDEGRVRRRAALAIGRVGIAAGVAPLSEALKDGDPEVREMAAFALGLIGDRASVPILTAALGDPDDRVQGRAAESLGLIGEGEPAAAIGQMIARHAAAAASIDPDDLSPSHLPSVEAFRLGVFALVRLKAWEPLAAVVLAPGGEPRVPWWPVAFALQRLQDARAIPALLWFARQGGRESAAFAVRGLGLLEAAATSEPRSDLGVVSTLLRILESGDSDPRVVVAAVRSLGQIGDQRAAASLIKILQRPELDPSLRLEAVVALGVLRAPEAVGILTDLTGASWAPLRGAAFTALAATDPESLMFVLSSLDADAAWTVRSELATALSSLDPEFALPRVGAMLKDSDVRVLPRVLEALVRLDAAGVDAVLVDHLGASDAVVRATAATLLGQRKPREATGPLEQAYEASKADATYVARAAILTALSKYDGGLAKNVLRDALADPDWAVRRRAAELLHAADPATDVSAVRPAPTRHSGADYANPALIAPPYSTHVYFETAKGTIEAELAVLDAPLTAANFVGLVQQGYYDGLTFHRVVPNFVIQGGDPRGDGEGGPGYTIRDEINTRPCLRGTLGMALDWADTGGSQFFITHGPQPHLDGRYTVFGHVVAGQEVVDRIVRGDVIERVRVWNGVEWIEGPPR